MTLSEASPRLLQPCFFLSASIPSKPRHSVEDPRFLADEPLIKGWSPAARAACACLPSGSFLSLADAQELLGSFEVEGGGCQDEQLLETHLFGPMCRRRV